MTAAVGIADSGVVQALDAGGNPGLKTYRHGTHRTVSPMQTITRVRAHMRAMGMTRIANVTGLDRLGVPVVTVCRPNARSVSMAQGKGLDLSTAKASALMESAEVFHAERVEAPLRLGNARTLGRHLPLVDVDALPASRLRAFRPDTDLLWVEGTDWLGEGPVWLPLETVSADYTLPLPPGAGCFTASTNGLASGNCLLEAVSHGLCEVVERDAVTLWKLGGQRARRERALNPGSVDDPACLSVMERFRTAGIRLALWDVTSDVGVPAFCCLAVGGEDDWADPEFGAGCHPHRAVALLRALTEAAQARTTFIAGSRDDLGAELYAPPARARRRWHCAGLVAEHAPVRAFDDGVSLDAETVAGDLRWVLERVRAAGVGQVAVVDLTRAELGIPVVRVVVPGLEGPYGHVHGDVVPGARARRLLPALG